VWVNISNGILRRIVLSCFLYYISRRAAAEAGISGSVDAGEIG
jgi:hypothetical protein